MLYFIYKEFPPFARIHLTVSKSFLFIAFISTLRSQGTSFLLNHFNSASLRADTAITQEDLLKVNPLVWHHSTATRFPALKAVSLKSSMSHRYPLFFVHVNIVSLLAFLANTRHILWRQGHPFEAAHRKHSNEFSLAARLRVW